MFKLIITFFGFININIKETIIDRYKPSLFEDEFNIEDRKLGTTIIE